MDFSTATLVNSMLIGSIGGFLFLYGKNTQKYACVGVGLLMFIYPCFLGTIICWILTLLLLTPLYIYRHSL